MFYFYKQEQHILCSLNGALNFKKISVPTDEKSTFYFLQNLPNAGKRRYQISTAAMLFDDCEKLETVLLKRELQEDVPPVLLKGIQEGNVCGINTNYFDYLRLLGRKQPKKWRVTLVGLGDVGANLIVGLRLLGRGTVASVGIYSSEENSAKRLEMEINQIYEAFSEEAFPEIRIIEKEQLMDTELFVFVASKGVPPLDTKVEDVRLAQYRGNCEILQEYAKMAREADYKGIFAVVSDPVDQLCNFAYRASNQDDVGNFDGRGLGGEQIHGFGLGVMNARARYFSKQIKGAGGYDKNGRAFGPHGEGLIIANDVEQYDAAVSEQLTRSTITANLTVRGLGFKPYIAPAFSSGAFSLLALMKGNWHYSSTLIDGAFLGIKNRETRTGIEVEKLALPKVLFEKIQQTHEQLKNFPR